MYLNTLYDIFFNQSSLRYLIRKLENIPLRGDKGLKDKAELYTFRLECYNYIIQTLDQIKKSRDPLDLAFGNRYTQDTMLVLAKRKNVLLKIAYLLQDALHQNVAIDTIAINANQFTSTEEINTKYKESIYFKDIQKCITYLIKYIRSYDK